MQKVAESKTTTVTGGLSAVAGVILALIPAEVRGGCIDAIQGADNPMLVGGLVVVGLILTLVGPSLKR